MIIFLKKEWTSGMMLFDFFYKRGR